MPTILYCLVALALSACAGMQNPAVMTPIEWPSHGCDSTSCPVPEREPAENPPRETHCREQARADAFARYSGMTHAFRNAREEELYQRCLHATP